MLSKWSHQNIFANFLVLTRPKRLLFSNKRKRVKIGQNAFALNQGDTPLPLTRLNGLKLAKSIPLARLEGLKKHTLAGGTSPGTFTMEEPPPPLAFSRHLRTKVLLWSLLFSCQFDFSYESKGKLRFKLHSNVKNLHSMSKYS